MAWMDQMDHHSVNLILTIDRIWKKCEQVLLHYRCQALHVISNLVEHQTSDKWRRREGKVVGLLWLMRQYTDLLRDLARTHRQHHTPTLATCDPVTLWVVKSEHTIMCGEWKQDKIFVELLVLKRHIVKLVTQIKLLFV